MEGRLIPSTAQVLSGLAALLGLIGVATGWFSTAGLTVALPTLQPLVSLCLLLAGLALLLASFSHHVARHLARGFALALGVGALYSTLAPEVGSGPYTGTLPPATALGFFAVAACVWLPGRRAVPLASVGLMLVALVIVAGFLEVATLRDLAGLSTASLPGGFGLLLLFAAILVSHPNVGWVRLVAAPTPRARGTRALLMWVVVVPLGLGWLALWGERSGFYDSRFRFALLTVLTIASLALLVLNSAARSRRMERERQLSDATTRLSEDRLRLATTATGVGIWDINVQSNDVYWSPEARAICGFESADPVNEDTFRERIHRDDIAKVMAAGDSLRQGATTFAMEHRLTLPSPDGGDRWVAVNGSAVRKDGRLVRIVGTILDITPRKRARGALEESERRLQLAIEALHGYVYDWDCLSGRVTRSSGFSRLLGYHGTDGGDSPEWWSSCIHPEDRPRFEQASRSAFSGVEQSCSCEYRARHRDGYYLWIWDQSVFLRDAGGTLQRIVGNVIDITARKTAEDRLQEAGRRLELAIDAANIGMWDWDLRTDEVSWSAKCYEITGLSKSDFGGNRRAFLALVLAEDVPKVQAAISTAIRERTTFECEFRFRRPTGEVRWAQNRAGVVLDAVGEPVRLVGTLIDVTLRKAVEVEREALLIAERAARVETDRIGQLKDDFLATVSHELRTPLNAIMGWLLLLKRSGAGPQALADGLEVIERNVRVQAQLITDLFDVNRIMSGKLTLELQPVDLNEVVQDALKSVIPTAQEKGVELRADMADDTLLVEGDARRLQQVVANLLTNAIKFTPAKGLIAISTRAENRKATIVVRDTGEGIPADFLPFLFERFRQGDGSRTRRHGGLGLGLAIAKQLVDLHGGLIAASSKGTGHGAEFIVALPVLVTDEPRRGAPPLTRPEPVGFQPDSLTGLRVLVVDDQTEALDYLGRVLEEQGATVARAASAHAAIAALSNGGQVFDVLISDIGMPEASGYDLIQAVRSTLHLDAAQLPAIAVTAFAREEDRMRALGYGFQYHLAKPFQVIDLINSVRQVTAHREYPASGARPVATAVSELEDK